MSDKEGEVHTCIATQEEYGFDWCNVKVRMGFSIDGAHSVCVNDVNIYVSPKGKSVRVFKNGKELK